MNISRRLLLSCSFAALLVSSLGAEATNNASFELGPDPGEAMTVAVGAGTITGWTVSRNAIEYVGSRWDASEGLRSVALNGTAPGGIAQTISTSPGQTYTVHFFMGGDAFSNPVMKHMRVQAAGASQDYEFDASHAWPWGMGWLEKTFVFTAGTTSTTLEFYSLDPGDTGPVIDNVTLVTPVDALPLGRSDILLGAPTPNPARQTFSLDFVLSTDTPVRLSIWDVRGREVFVMAEGTRPAGRYTERWDGNIGGRPAAAGLYIVRLEAPGVTLVRKAVLSR